MSEKKENNIILFKKVGDLDKYNFYDYLSVMLDSGLWVVNALEGVWEKLDNVYFKQKINELIVFVSSWDPLSKAMKKIPDVFSAYETSVVEAWETTWTLDKSLWNLAENIRSIYELKKKVKWSLTYPLIIFLFLIVAVTIILTYVIPALKPLFEWFWAELPFATKALIATSNFVINNFLVIIFFIISIIIWVLIYKTSESWKKNLDNFVLSMPLIGPVYRNYIISNISLTMANLIWAWVPTIKMLKLTWKASNSYVYEKLFELIAKKVWLWEKIVDSIEEVDKEKFYFPSTFIQMLSVWEKTANLETICYKINKQFKREVEYSLANLTKWVEPLAVAFASIFVLWFAFAIFWAIMKLTSAIW